jgi:membrane fusion protein (multidrug efflux system)
MSQNFVCFTRWINILAALCFSAVSASAQDTATAVDVHIVKVQDVRPIMRFPTRLKAWEAVHIIPRVEGYLLEKAHVSGEHVDKGDVLYRIEPDAFELELSEANANLEEAIARLSFAEKTLRRAEALADREVVSKQDFDQYVSSYGIALSDVTAATRNVELAEIRLGYTEIHAPISGVISNENKALGDLVGPDRGAVGRLNMVDRIRAWVFLDEKIDNQLYARELAGENIEYDISLTLAGDVDYPLPGRVTAWDNEVDAKTGTRAIQIEFANPDLVLTQGMSGTISVTENSSGGNIAIPQNTVMQDQVGRYVLVITDDETLEPRYATFGPQVGTWWIVRDGLEIGDRVAASNLQLVGPGSLVSPNN